MKLVYICSPYSGDIENNVKKAQKYSRFAVDCGVIPIAPHLLLPQFMSEETERDKAMLINLALLDRCDALWVFGSEYSPGMLVEIAHAEKNSKRIVFRED